MIIDRGSLDATNVVFQMREVTKAFGSTIALESANLVVRAGEIHALLGENGAGKSTLINIATGVHQADTGDVLLNGKPVRFVKPLDATGQGIAVVHQERSLVGPFSVAENLFLGRQLCSNGLVSYSRMADEARQWLEEVGLDVNPHTQARTLSPGQSQLLEVARALSSRCRVLFLDEPTSSIAEGDVEHLLALLRQLRDDGTAIVFVSHKLEEVYDLCDRVTVLRDGRNVLSDRTLSQTSSDEVINAMVGRSLEVSAPKGVSEKRPQDPGVEPLLELCEVSTEYGHRDVSFAVRPGEIVGMYGLIGAGRTEVARCIMGLGRVTGGEVRIKGRHVRVRNPYDALRNQRMGYLSEDRKGEGLILEHSISRNGSITVWDKMRARGGWITDRVTGPIVSEHVERLSIKTQGIDQVVSGLSGGNQQKVSLAKWLAADVDILVLDEPTVGVDISAKNEVHSVVRELAAMGKALLLITSDLRELVELADRILVMADFKICGEVENTGDYSSMSSFIMERITGSDDVLISS